MDLGSITSFVYHKTEITGIHAMFQYIVTSSLFVIGKHSEAMSVQSADVFRPFVHHSLETRTPTASSTAGPSDIRVALSKHGVNNVLLQDNIDGVGLGGNSGKLMAHGTPQLQAEELDDILIS